MIKTVLLIHLFAASAVFGFDAIPLVHFHSTIKHEQISVVANRINTDAATLQTITAGQIQQTPALTSDDLLRRAAGFQLFRRSGSRTANPTSQGVSLRGIGSNGASRALVLRNGIPINDPFGGWVYWGRITPLSLDAIQVFSGGGSDLYGNTAISGIIDFQTTESRTPEVSAIIGAANQNTHHFEINGALRGFQVFGETFHSDGYLLLAPGSRGSIDHPAGSDHDSWDLGWTHNSARDRFFVDGSYYHEFRNNGTELQINESQIRQLSFGADHELSHGLLSARGYAGSETLDQQFSIIGADRNSETLASVQHVPSTNFGFNLSWNYSIKNHELLAGSDGLQIHGTTQETFLNAGGSQRSIGVFLQDRIAFTDWLSVLIGNRFDNWENYEGHSGDTQFDSRNENAWSPRASATVELSKHFQLHGSWYRAFRAPTLNELYRSFRLGSIFTEANAILAAETLTGIESGVTWKAGRIDLTSNVFRMMLHNAIGNATLSTSPQILRQRQNVGEIQSTGFDVQFGMQVMDRWRVDTVYQFADSIVASSTASPALVGNNTPQVPKNMVTVSSEWQASKRLSASVLLRFVGKQYDDDLNLLPLAQYTAFDGQLRFHINSLLQAFVNVQNLFNTQYELARIPYPTYGSPRLVEFGIAFHRD